MKTFPTLYKRTKTGAIQTWQIEIDGDSFYTIEGQKDGILSESKPTICEGKNFGKSNETTPEMQALAQATAKHRKKLETGYALDVNDIDTCRKYTEPMLAHKYIEYKDKVQFPILASTKIDGMRMVCVDGATTTRNGTNIVSCPHISKALEPLFERYPNAMVDGEVYAADECFEKCMSLVKKTKPTIENLIESEQKCKLWVFDGDTKHSGMGFMDRFATIRDAILHTVDPKHLKYFVFVENVTVNSHEEIETEHAKYVSQGFEGIILRVADAPYENKRSKNLLKYKYFTDEEFILVDLLDGVGSDAGIASKAIVRLKNGGTSESGIRGTNEYTAQLLKDKKHYIGKLVTTRYQGFTKDGKLRFGVCLNFDPIDR